MQIEKQKSLIKAATVFLTYEELVRKKVPPRSVFDFYKFRRELYDFVLSTLDTRIAIINAEVKVGKKDMVIFNSLFSKQSKGRSIVHFYVTALVRKEIKEQADQLEEAGVVVLTKPTKDDIVKVAIKQVERQLSEGKKVIIHFDESDYGTDFKSRWSPLFNRFISNECCFWRLYSATNEEAELSKLSSEYNAKIYKYIAPKAYKGAKWFLENGLVYEAEPFFYLDHDGEMELTYHGDKIIQDFLCEEQKRPVLIARHSTGNEYNLLNKSDFSSRMIQHKIEVIFVDKDNNFDWAKGTVDAVNRYRASGVKTFIVLNQKATRATEIYCQAYLYGFHDHRKISTNYNTYAQSSLRVAHYDEVGHPIKLWTSIEVIQKAAGMIGNEQFLNTGRNISNRIGKVTTTIKNIEYHIYDSKQDVPQELFRYRKETDTYWTLSKNNKRDLAKSILNGMDLSNEDQVRVIYVDGPNTSNEQNISSFEQLKNKYPELIGKWITHKKIEKTKQYTAYTKEGSRNASIFNKLEKIASWENKGNKMKLQKALNCPDCWEKAKEI